MEYLSKPCTISIITDNVVKSTLWDRIPFKLLPLAVTGISALLIKYVVQKKITVYIQTHILAYVAVSQKLEQELMEKEMQTFIYLTEKEMRIFTKWFQKEKAALIYLEEQEKIKQKDSIAILRRISGGRLEYNDFKPFKERIVKELKNQQHKTLNELEKIQGLIMNDLKLLQRGRRP